MNLRKFFLYSSIVVALFVAAGWYIDHQVVPMQSPYPESARQGDSTAMDKIDFHNYGPAPDFAGISHWLNSDPLTIASLKGKVILVDFWTYSCINCIRTLPHVTQWYDTYKDKGFVVVGVHTPEFAFEKETKNVADAIGRFNIHYPVAQDNDYATWNNYSNEYWPAEYLIDQQGNVVYVHFGEGNYDQTENAIRSLLGLDTKKIETSQVDVQAKVQSPEMYFGTDRLQNLIDKQTASRAARQYTFPHDLEANTFALQGLWQFTPKSLVLMGKQGKIRLSFHAGKVHLVAASPASAQLSVSVDGSPQPDVSVGESELYTLFDSNDYTDHIIDITVTGQGFEAFTFTFG